MKERTRKKLQNREGRRFWNRLLCFLSCVTVFCTTFALVLPAISMEKNVSCGMEEHQHDDSCYEEELVCGQEEKEAHHHTDQCYTVEERLICGEKEHSHGEGCYDSQGNLTCTLAEHSHTDECYEESRILTCSLEETEGHTHSASCYEKVLVCGQEVHIHTDKCYKNSGSTSEDDQTQQSTASVDSANPAYTADQAAEAAGDAASNAWGQTAEETVRKAVAGELVFDGPDYTVRASFGREAGIPAGAELEVSEILPEPGAEDKGAAYEEYLEKTGEALEMETTDFRYARFFDIKIVETVGETKEKVIIAAPVDVKIDLAEQDPPEDAEATTRVVHFADEKSTGEIVENVEVSPVLPKTEQGTELSFEAPGFSIYGVIRTTMEDTVLASDGRNYKVTVTCGPEAGIPDGAELHVEEITEDSSAYDTYVANTETALGMEEGSAGYIRLFDIKIADRNGKKVTISAPVDVKIELADKEMDVPVQVVHFADDSSTGDVIENVEVDGETVCLVADGFSAYAIVQGPEAGSVKGSILETLSDLSEAAADGEPLYLSINRQGAGEEYFKSTLQNNVLKLTDPSDLSDAAEWIFEPAGTENEYRIRIKDGNYIKQATAKQNNIALTSAASDASVFVLSAVGGDKKRFYIKLKEENRWLQYSGSGKGIRLYQDHNNAANSNIQIKLVHPPTIEEDPYSLDGKSYGLMNWSGEPTGKAVMASEEAAGTLDANVLTVMSAENNANQLFVSNDSDITMWSFAWISDDLYYLRASAGGEEKYLRIDDSGVSLVSTADDLCKIQIIPGTGSHSGQISLKCGGQMLTYKTTGQGETLSRGFSIGGEAGSEWLNFVMLSELTSEYFMTHTARKVSVSDSTVTNGSKVIVYTRVWNNETKKYDYYAVDSDGSLVTVYESGDHIQWVGGQFNSLLWDFVEYYQEGTTDPNFYYELYNEYSEKFISPRETGGQVLSDSPVGINLDGRRNGQYYSSVVVWDDDKYAYTGLKTDTTDMHSIVSCPLKEAQDFYFAIVQDIPTGDELTTVDTVNNKLHGISMKMIDFASRKEMSDFLGNNDDAAYSGNAAVLKQGLLSTNLTNGYPTVTNNGQSLSGLYGSGLRDVNHLFIQSTYDETGYFEYDSTQNFASLHGENFKVYKELGTYDAGGNKSTLKHGQFFPFNDLKPGVFAVVNGKNLYSALADFRSDHQNTGLLPDGTPRKYEQLYSIAHGNEKANTFFGMELEASFTQTPDGLDDWGHDIIFEFTGDDDFWLYVDGELVIDLGGMHSAVPGSVNFATGEVKVHGVDTTLREVFESNYKKRKPNATDNEVAAFLAEYFDEGKTVFKEYTQHSMKIFYMERGAGASNLHMRFNLASVRKGHVLLRKELDGVSNPDSFQAEFPYQIYYTLPAEHEGDIPQEQLLTQGASNINVYYKDSIKPVKHRDTCEIGGVTYDSVFFLKPGEVADIAVPDSAINYRIVECGVNKSIYDSVSVKEDENLTEKKNSGNGRYDYSLSSRTTEARPRVTYVNHVAPDALKTLTFEKVLYAEDGVTRIHHGQDDTPFNFRLSLGTEFGELQAANMQTYHVKNNMGEYCKWDSTLETPGFVSLGEGKIDFTQLTDQEKYAATFHSSINGAITKIPVDYTVEIREVLVGTQYKIEERDSEIPDGYSRQKYVLYEDGAGTAGEDNYDAIVKGVIESNPHVEVCNLKGFGLRINKAWSDKRYMADRAPTYFAVFTDDGNGNLTLVEDASNNIITVRQLPYSANPQTLYWYFEHLPVSNVPFANYKVREVTLGNANPTVSSDGTVTNHGMVTPVGDKGTVIIAGRQIGQNESTGYEYTVSYDDGEIIPGSNVHVFEAENKRPGVKLFKMDGDTPLANAKFRLTKDGTLIGTYTSDENGLVTEAYLLPGQTYTYELMETNSPQGYQGIQQPIQLTLVGDTLTVVDENGETHSYTPAEGDTMPTYTVQNRKYEFKVVKKNQSGQALSGVTFALHKQKTVGGHTGIDVNPENGYDSLTTGADGIVPKLDDTLPPGTYELRETAPPSGYEALSEHIRFTISDTGMISLVEGYYPEGEAEMTVDTTSDPGKVTYTITVINRCPPMALKKEDNSGNPLPGATFKLMTLNAGNVWVDMGEDGLIDMSSVAAAALPSLTNGRYRLEEQIAPEGYVIMTKYVYFTVENGAVTLTNETGTPGSTNPQAALDGDNVNGYTLTIKNIPGAELPYTGGPGTRLIYLFGALLMAISGTGFMLKRRREKSAKCNFL